jgi:regulatory protein
MVSAAHAEDSSSASANSRISIQKMEWASAGILKVYLADGPSFFVRDAYLPALPEGALSGLEPLDEDASSLLLEAGSAYLAERAAMDYLSRAEHSRFLLVAKLRKKGYDERAISVSLDYLAGRGYLDDHRYAAAWLRSRMIHQSEGRQKLYGSLVAHGVSSTDARDALSEFFADVDEAELCAKAARKLASRGKDGDRLFAALSRKGFSTRLIREIMEKMR